MPTCKSAYDLQTGTDINPSNRCSRVLWAVCLYRISTKPNEKREKEDKNSPTPPIKCGFSCSSFRDSEGHTLQFHGHLRHQILSQSQERKDVGSMAQTALRPK
jgi:hypothetical protein